MAALAAIAAGRGDRAEALGWLDSLAATGLERHVAHDTTFRALAGDSAFQRVAARLAANGRSIASATVAARFDDAELLTEDVAWDAARRRFLISSIHRHEILALDDAGKTSVFFRADSDDLWGFYGLALDARRGRLWATTAAGPNVEGYVAADSGRTALVGFDVATGKRLERVELPRDGARHVLGDVGLGEDGVVYVTDSLGGGVYRFVPGRAAFDTLAPSGTFGSPQCPVVAAGGRRLLVPDYPRGIATLTLATHEIEWLAKPRTLAEGGIDGLCLIGGRLLAVQNGTEPHRVLELTLDPAGERIVAWRVLEQASADLGEPNHGVVAGPDFYFIGNSGWERVNADEQLVTPPGSKGPVLLRLAGAARP
jgi:sugar lactone lactonase YvrE